jgi:glucokinase
VIVPRRESYLPRFDALAVHLAPEIADSSDPSEWVIGGDLGGTKLIFGVVGPASRIEVRQRRDVPAHGGPESVLGTVVECLEACRREAGGAVRAVGLGVAGQVDPSTGVVVHAPNLRWREFPFGERLHEATGLPVVIANDARTITLGEWHFGEPRRSPNFLCVCLGTGVGGGAVVDGHLLEGGAHAAGEVGHSTLVAGGRACHCANRGCLEAYVGGWAIQERVQEAARAAPVAAERLVASAGSVPQITPLLLERAARAGDPFSQRFLHRVAEEFASGIVGLVNSFNPEVVVVTGKIAEGYPEFVAAAQRAVQDRCQPPAAGAQVLPSRLGADAGILGATVLARARLRGAPA